MSERKNISKKLRFEVFKRDSFTCQYCGKSAPDAILEVDHIEPVSKGGKNNITNLITSCFDCNRGKSDRKLTENQTLKAQKKELDKLNQRKEQLEMMAKWQMELIDIEKQEAEKIIEVINARCDTNYSTSESNIKEFSKVVKKYGFSETLEGAIIAIEKHGESTTFKNITGICHMRKTDSEKPYMKDLYYIRGILKNRFRYKNLNGILEELEEAYKEGLSIDKMKLIAKKCDDIEGFYIELGFYLKEGE